MQGLRSPHAGGATELVEGVLGFGNGGSHREQSDAKHATACSASSFLLSPFLTRSGFSSIGAFSVVTRSVLWPGWYVPLGTRPRLRRRVCATRYSPSLKYPGISSCACAVFLTLLRRHQLKLTVYVCAYVLILVAGETCGRANLPTVT